MFGITVCCSVAQSCLTVCDPMDCSMPGFPVLHYLPEFAQIHVLWVGNAIQLSHPLLLPSPSLNLSQHQDLFQWVGFPHLVAKYWSFSISPSNEYSGLISFRIDWFDLLAVQEWSTDHLSWCIYSQSGNLARSGWNSILFLYQSNKPLPLSCTVAGTETTEWQGHGLGP